MGVKSVLADELLYYCECCIFGFPKFTHYVFWWRLAFSTGASHLHISFRLTPKTDER